jgi:hypothetical protein
MPEHFYGFTLPHQIDFVGDDNCGYGLLFGDDQKAVQHPHIGGRFGARKGEDDLIGIGNDDLFIFTPLRWRQSRELIASFLDLFDHDGIITMDRDLYPISNRNQISGFLPFFQPPAQTGYNLTLIGIDSEKP